MRVIETWKRKIACEEKNIGQKLNDKALYIQI